MKRLEILIDQRNQLLQQMSEYNKRLDRTVMLYLTALYAAIGLRVTGKIEINSFYQDPEITLIAFLFVFLNYCIITHGISQSSWAMSLAKFVHNNVDEDIRLVLRENNEPFPKSIAGWDDWTSEIKGLANLSRNIVVGLWVLIVLGASLYSLRLVNIKEFYSQQFFLTVSSGILLYLFQTYVIYIGLLELYFITKFHLRSEKIAPPLLRLGFLALVLSSCLVTLCVMFVIR